MRNSRSSKLGGFTLAGIVCVGALACGSGDTAPKSKGSSPSPPLPSSTLASSFDIKASPQTTAETGIVVWKGVQAGASVQVEGMTADGTVRLMIASATPSVADTAGSLVVETRTSDPAGGPARIERGTLEIRDGKVESNTLPSIAASFAGRFKVDFEATPRIEDAQSCSQAKFAYTIALGEEVVACAFAETPVTAAICGLAAANALSAAQYLTIQCTNCGGSCTGIGYKCDGAGTCACTSTGCGTSCGNITDNCGHTLYCGACYCTSTGCQGRCGNVLDNCGHQISCGPCEDDTDGGDEYGYGGGSDDDAGEGYLNNQ
jgi:hypothetical protein